VQRFARTNQVSPDTAEHLQRLFIGLPDDSMQLAKRVRAYDYSNATERALKASRDFWNDASQRAHHFVSVTSVWYTKTAHPWLETNTREWRANAYTIAVRCGDHAYAAGSVAMDSSKRAFDWTWITVEDLYVRRHEHWESVQSYWRNIK